MRRLLVLAAFLAATPALAPVASATDFRLYPGFTDPNAVVEMTTDKGLIVEIVLRCSRSDRGVRAGIMTYSKVERLFCSSRMRCTTSAARAARETCGWG